MKNLTLRNIILIGIALEALVALFAWMTTATPVDFFQTSARISGRVSLVVFTFLFLYASNRNRNLATENAWFVGFAVVHVIHFGFLATFIYLSGVALIPIRLVGGIIAYLLTVVYPFMVLRNLGDNKLRSRVREAHLYFVWFVMFMTYLSRVKAEQSWVGGDMAHYQFLFGFVITLLIGQVILRYKNRVVA
jgi:uncharacterized membrane protein